jgi:hypothetical protein
MPPTRMWLPPCALTVVSIIAAVVCSLRLRSRPPAVRAQAAPIAAHHPGGRRAHHYPPRHVLTWTARWIGMLLILVVAVISVPAVVDGGVMETGGAGTSASWPDVVPLGRPFQIREPVWRWGLGLALIDSDKTAVIAVVVSLLIEGAGVLVLVKLVQLARNWRRRHGQRQAAIAPASAS